MLTYLGKKDARYHRLEEYLAGMKLRIKLAHALVDDSPALILDEPMNGLDPDEWEAILANRSSCRRTC